MPSLPYYIHVEIAGVKIEIAFRSKAGFAPFSKYLARFSEPDVVVYATDEELRELAETYLLSDEDEHFDEIVGLESQIVFRKLAVQMLGYEVLLFHGSVVAMDGCAYMFAAPSGTGNSTRTKLWLDLYPDSFVINGDKPFIKVTDTEALACSSPWCGKEGWNTNAKVPLRAIFLLKRGETDSVERLSFEEALPTLLKQTNLPNDTTALVTSIDLLKSPVLTAELYSFTSTPTAESIWYLHYSAAKRIS